MRKKLFLSTIGIVLITLILSVVSVNLVFRNKFSGYIAQSTDAMLKQLPSRISATYEGNGNWNTSALNDIASSLPIEVYVILKDTQGNIIANLGNPMNDMHSPNGMMNMMGSRMGGNLTQYETKELQITGSQGPIGTAEVHFPSGTRILNPQDRAFSSQIFYSLIIAGIVSLLIGALLSYFISRRLVSPLKNLTQAAYQIGEGNLDEHVASSSKDEIGLLANAFNSMTDNLKRQEKLRKQLVADIAHELRTPLTSMRSYVEAFQDGVLPADADNLASINEEIERLVGLVSDLKDLNIAEMGALAVSLHPVDLVAIIDKATHNLSPLVQDKGLSLSFMHQEPQADILGDQHLLTRLFYNLIHNSYKYTEPGGRITVELNSMEDSVQVLIHDTGIGISKSDLPFIFERFYRTDRSRTRETGGSGIGLTLVKQIVVLHQGNISVESKMGEGSVFTVTLPKPAYN